MANHEEYRIDDTRFNWRCSYQERKRLKILAAERGCNMNEILSRAFLMYWKVQQRKNRVKIRKTSFT